MSNWLDLLRSKYFYAGHSRFLFGWENPNAAAAVLVSLLPVLWCGYHVLAARKRKLYIGVLVALEGLLLWMVVITYSRGAVIGLACAMLFFHLFARFANDPNWQKWRLAALCSRLGLLALFMGASGLFRRMASVAEGDRSAINRLDLWHGSLRLIAASPWRGWGRGSSGIAFSQWVQNPASKLTYLSAVNGYLSIAVDFGLFVLAALIFFLVFPILLGTLTRGEKIERSRPAILACCSGVLAFAVANCFTTLSTLPSVVWAPLSLILFILVLALQKSPLKKPGIGAWVTAVVVTGLLEVVSVVSAGSSAWRVNLKENGSVELLKTGSQSRAPLVYFLPDWRTLGLYFGREIRAALDRAPTSIRCVVCPPGTSPKVATDSAIYIVFGSRVTELTNVSLARTIIVFPTVEPKLPGANGIPLKIILPELDQVGFTDQWRTWATARGCHVETIPLVGQNIEGQFATLWPSVFEQDK